MAFLEDYHNQVALLLRTIPFVAAEPDFALKGGTAINLFVRDMPRLSVDIDLTYLPVADRTASLAAIDAGMERIAQRIEAGIPGVHVARSRLQKEGIVTRLVVRDGTAQIKIEVTPVLRGAVYEPVETDVSALVEDTFGYARIAVVSFADLYAGKIVAALDRQHPRDLFDVRDLLANEGISDELRRAFVVYILSHNRPMADILAPTRKDLEEEFARGFEGMTQEPVPLGELIEARERLVRLIVTDMPAEHRRFLLGFKRGEPDWDLLGLPGAVDLPAVRWRQQNLAKLPADRRAGLIERLEAVFAADG
ncbi:nucleotidyl transferase AbiEii/AbiGii toxin family protein [Novosphingobium decolorationis]|uniref:Nucleotidyl transferase AbiEii/AbiGii toxin family protein n=1 Tax=Novosphingobium decolorationis TaxID=2698673 RepID=A0ABX8E5Z9_9SPHN|nr:nucleotidyl transferase AbiEii/AbiGii toxin family protein [Novosphingobium decolorationis]QVM84543.1 nucleotidyl transferase AbiEii/AbiGii toxin family protein [Novosphingobium decolorationis]